MRAMSDHLFTDALSKLTKSQMLNLLIEETGSKAVYGDYTFMEKIIEISEVKED
jgi:hypothetical protein